MFIVLLWKEIREHLMTFRFAAALVTITLLIVCSVWFLGEDYQRRLNSYLQASEAAALLEREYVVPSEISPTLFRPPSPLSMFTQGEDRRFGNSIQIKRWEVPREATGNYGTGLLMAAQAPFDLFTIVATVVSLFGILLTYDAISGERERGLLRVQSSYGASRLTLYSAKFLGAAVCLTIPIVLGLTASLVALNFILDIVFTPGEWLAVGGVAFASVLYGTVFVALGLGCSVLVRRSSAAIVLALLVWTITVVVVPSVAQGAAGTLSPLDSQFAISSLERGTEADARKKHEELADKYPAYEFGYWTSSFSIKSERFFKYDSWEQGYRDAESFIRGLELVMQARADTIRQAYRESEARKAEQSETEQLLAVFSPSHHLRHALTSLTSTNYSRYEDYLEAARRYRAELLDNFRRKGYFSDNVLSFFSQRDPEEIDDAKYGERVAYYRSQLESGKRYDEFMGPKFLEPVSASDLPPFEYSFFGIDSGSVIWPLGILAIELALLLATGLAVFQRYDIR